MAMETFAKAMKQEPKNTETWTQWHTDRSVVCAFRAKGTLGSKLTAFEPSPDMDASKIVDDLEKTGEQVTIDTDLLRHVLRLVTSKEFTKDTVRIIAKKDMPLVIKTDDMEIIIVPRVGE